MAIADTTVPDGLGKVAREEWERVIGPLIKAGRYTDADRSTLAEYCGLWAVFQGMVKELSEEPAGPLVLSSEGEPSAAAWLGVIKRVVARLSMMMVGLFEVDSADVDLGVGPPVSRRGG